MKNLLLTLFCVLALISCNEKDKKNESLNAMFDNYYEDRLKFYPLEATSQGDSRYDDILPNNISQKFRTDLLAFYQNYSDQLETIKEAELSPQDKVYFDTFRFTLNSEIEALSFPSHLLPFNQFEGLPLTFAQLGSGEASQPFKNVKDYENWLKRIDQFTVWADTAIVNFDKGIIKGIVLPKSLIVKMIPQMQDLAKGTVEESIFYGPIKNMPAGIDSLQKNKLKELYTAAISNKLQPTYKKLADYLSNTYLKSGRPSSGIGAIPIGKSYYKYLAYQWTTTTTSPDEIFQIGLTEVNRIKAEMEKVKAEVGFKGDLSAFFESVKKDPKLMPYSKPEEILKAFADIKSVIDPKLASMFNNTPKTQFEIRRTEAFRENSASAEYMQGSSDGTRPGIFYIPIPDAKVFNITSGMESLFLHEAIPGHHYQVSLQQENTNLPKFMRFNWYGAYGEGWALYCESLGKELGLYTNPYQYFGALGDEMHRAIRLVVDVAIHTKGWTREEAIKYMMDNEAISLQGATAEIERYMAIPGQALSYKIGALKIRELRTKLSQDLGVKFNLAAFHDEVLKNGCLPLSVLEENLDAWAEGLKTKS